MPVSLALLLIVITGFVGLVLGYVFRWLLTLGRRGSLEIQIKKKLLEAREEADLILKEARNNAAEIENKASIERNQREDALNEREHLLVEREQAYERKLKELKKKETDLTLLDQDLTLKEREYSTALAELRQQLSDMSSLSMEQGRDILMEQIKEEYEEDINAVIRKLDADAKSKIDSKTKAILTQSLQRLSTSVVANNTTTAIELRNEDDKGKIIGKEGRNIRTFEHAAGVELLIDDSPDTVFISSFDPLRRHVAKIALERLLEDGRIQPTRIEEELEKAHKEAEELMKEQGEQAAFMVGVYGLEPGLTSLLGKLHFRTSYGQNVLQHSIEVARLSEMIATEIGADIQVAKTAGLLHDIGKAADEEAKGTHIEIGIRYLKRFGIDEEIINAMKSHHDDYPHSSIEAAIVQAADIISASRPGARRENYEGFVERLKELERIANEESGVDNAYAIQAGRELRIFVDPEAVTDLDLRNLARRIAQRIESELSYPGEVRIHLIRESRVIDFAR